MGRYYADTFDADGKHYVFDALRQGDECAGPFDTIEAAEAEAERLNGPLPSYIPRIECQDSDSMVVLLDGLAGFHVDLAYVEGQAPYCSNPVQIMHTDQDGDLVVCEVVKGNPTNSTWAIPLATLATITVL